MLLISRMESWHFQIISDLKSKEANVDLQIESGEDPGIG
jgi:hypothetical protein